MGTEEPHTTLSIMDIKKQALTSASHSDFTLEALRQIAPSAFTEVRDEQGELTHKVDFDVLKELLGDKILDSDEERFGFYWVGKQDAKRAAAEPTRKTLRPVLEDSVDWDNTQNLYIEGDNLEVLKLLQRAYLGKVKMIYIDPPYNTGNDFVYDDDFAMSREDMDDAMGNLDEEGNRLRRNLDSNPRYHSDWCSMIYSRLLVARTLLANDGVIFISIDDNEVHHLRKICDEVFGASNFVDIFNWAKTETPENLSKKSRQIIEYVLCYQKAITPFKFKGVKKESASSNGLLNQSNKMKTLVFPSNIVRTSIPNGIVPLGSYGTNAYDVKLLKDTEVRDGLFIRPVILEARFKWSQTNLDEEIKRGTIIRIPTLKLSPSYEKAEYDAEVPTNLINSKVGVLTNETAGIYQESLFGRKVFNFPKPTSLIEYLLGFNEDAEEALVLDFFSGSASTADAVMRMNAMRGENKFRYILVQIQEDLDLSLNKVSDSTKQIIHNAIEFCAKEQLPHNICSIAKERIRRAGKKIKEEAEGVDLDTGFRVLRVDTSNMEEVYFEPDALQQDHLFGQVDSVKEDRSDLDLLFGCMVDWGVELSYPLRQEEVAGKHLYIVNEGALVACFEEDIDLEVIREIAKLEPLRVLFRESCFASDAAKLNIYEQFKQLCGWSAEESYRRIHVM